MASNADCEGNFVMKAIDVHSHYSTKRAYLWRTPEEVAIAEKKYKFKAVYKTEKGMAQDLRTANVKGMFDLGFTMEMPIEEVKKMHDYTAQFRRDYPDVFLGGWVSIDPRKGIKALRELERCLGDLGMIGLTVEASGLGIAPSNQALYPFYELCIEANAPVLICVGYTGWGEGLPGGGGFYLEHCHPRHVDKIASKFPELTIIAGRPAWPWQNEMIAVLLHKPNVWYELHGWSPKYFRQELKWEISHRLRDKVMFGADYPMFDYERLFKIWESEGYEQGILDNIFRNNALRLFDGLGYKID